MVQANKYFQTLYFIGANVLEIKREGGRGKERGGRPKVCGKIREVEEGRKEIETNGERDLQGNIARSTGIVYPTEKGV